MSPITVFFQLYRLHVKQHYDQLATWEPPNEMMLLGVRNRKLIQYRGRNFGYLMQRLMLSSDRHIFYSNRMCKPARGDAFGTSQNGLAQRLKLYESFVLASHVYVS